MNRATRAAAVALGIYAGALAVLHGVFEVLQGNLVPESSLIQAMGPACLPDTVWHACLPAFSLLPSFLWSGAAAIVLGLILVAWSLLGSSGKWGAPLMLLLSAGLLPVGSGFVPVWIGLVAAAAAWQMRRTAAASSGAARFLARFWPGALLAQLAWFPGSWLVGALAPILMLRLGGVVFILFDILLPLLTAISAIAFDRVRRAAK